MPQENRPGNVSSRNLPRLQADSRRNSVKKIVRRNRAQRLDTQNEAAKCTGGSPRAASRRCVRFTTAASDPACGRNKALPAIIHCFHHRNVKTDSPNSFKSRMKQKIPGAEND